LDDGARSDDGDRDKRGGDVGCEFRREVRGRRGHNFGHHEGRKQEEKSSGNVVFRPPPDHAGTNSWRSKEFKEFSLEMAGHLEDSNLRFQSFPL
jgi:hypothetical protein